MAKPVTPERYSELMELQIKNGVPFAEHYKGSRKTLWVHNQPFVTILDGGNYLELGEISNAQFKSFLGGFKKSLYSNLLKNPDLITKKIEYTGTSRGKNKEAFNDIQVDGYFWNLDLSSAYWQMGYRLGYISKSFYSKYIDKDTHKVAKRLCFSFLARENMKRYRINNEDYDIFCENSLDQQVYDNVRNELYNIIAGALEIVGDNYIDYNIDAISFPNKFRKEVVKYFEEQNLVFKLIPAIKHSETQYELKGKIRTF